MGTITHKAGRVAVGKAADVVIKNLDKDREKEILKLVSDLFLQMPFFSSIHSRESKTSGYAAFKERKD